MAERLRRKAAQGARKVSYASDYSSGGDAFDDAEGYSHDSTPQQRMEERLRQKAEMGEGGGGGGGHLEDRARAKAARAEG